jgi:hypothetical protein
MIEFRTVTLNFNQGTGTQTGQASFPFTPLKANVCLQGYNIGPYLNGDRWHFRGTTKIQPQNVVIEGSIVKFQANFDYQESDSNQMRGSVDFLVIAEGPSN